MAGTRTLTEKLLVLITLGDERTVARTYILGRELHSAAATCSGSPADA
jgi:hypothetical protein